MRVISAFLNSERVVRGAYTPLQQDSCEYVGAPEVRRGAVLRSSVVQVQYASSADISSFHVFLRQPKQATIA
jgi:hypothetical protein